jgi:hypothetical protein
VPDSGLMQLEGLPHLVVARMQQQASAAGFERADVRGVQMMLKRLFTRLPLRGRYTIIIERQRGVTELMCAFEQEGDAEEAAKVVGAGKTTCYAGWQSQRSFVLDGPKHDALSKIAGKYRQRHRPQQD